MATEKYYPPQYRHTQFHCAHCKVYARQYWGNLETWNKFSWQGLNGINLSDDFVVSKCAHCDRVTIWFEEAILYPRLITVEDANEDMPSDVKALYGESAQVLSISPRAAAALLRLGLQLLLGEVGGEGKNINADIKTIVASGVEPQTQKALDIIRVFGNNAAHPGEIQLDEDVQLVTSMYGMMNFITDRLISQKRQIDTMFDSLPEGVKAQIEDRDKKEPK